MSLTSDRTTLSRLNREIADLRTKEAGEAKKAADAQKKHSSALASARRASVSMAKSYLSTAEREAKGLQAAQENLSRYSSQAASKTQEAARLQARILRDEESERRKTAAAETQRRRNDAVARKAETDANAEMTRALQQRIDDLEAVLTEQLEAKASSTPAFRPTAPEGETEAYDVFISHAWEDKADFVQGLADRCRELGLRVWYDQFTLEWGDSIRQKIDAGLAGSYFGVAVLSPSFFAKSWTQYELDGLLDKAASGVGRMLPVWHKVSKDEVAKHAPSLAGRLALNTSFMSADEIAGDLKRLRDRYAANAAKVADAEGENSDEVPDTV